MTAIEVLALIRLIAEGAPEIIAIWKQITSGEPITPGQQAAATQKVKDSVANLTSAIGERFGNG
jgi:hypothetical protein